MDKLELDNQAEAAAELVTALQELVIEGSEKTRDHTTYITIRKFGTECTINAEWTVNWGAQKVITKDSAGNDYIQATLNVTVSYQNHGSNDRVGVLYEKPGDQKGSWLYFRRVFRVTSVESVVNRTKLALLEGAKKTQQMLKRPCPKCGAPTYDDSGRCIVQACREGVSTPKAQAKSKSAKRWPRRGKGRAVAPVQAPIMQEEVTHEPTDAELELLMDEEAQYAMASLADDVADGRLQQDEAQVASMIRGQF